MTIDPNTLTLPARRIQIVMTCGMALFLAITAGLAFATITKPSSVGPILADFGGFSTGPLMAWQTVALIGITAIHLTIWLLLLGTARHVFRHLADGEPEAASHAARNLANWLWAMLAWGLISQILVSLVATWGFPEGQRAISFGFGTPQVSIALSALIAGFMARAFALGAELWRDHSEVV